MSSSERLKAILEYLRISANKLSVEIGLDNNTKVYHIKNGRNEISSDMASLIVNRYPEINYTWLLEGTGEMLNDTAGDPGVEYVSKPKYEPEGKIITEDDYYIKETFVIPVKGRAGLENGMFDPISFRDLKIERQPVTQSASKGSVHFKIEVKGASMDNGKRGSLAEGDWAYCRSISKIYWRNRFNTDDYDIFCFFHIERGIIFKSIKEQKPETGDLLLESLNPDKELYPDFWIKSYDCSYICNVYKIVTEL